MTKRLVLVQGFGGAWIAAAREAAGRAPASFHILLVDVAQSSFVARFGRELSTLQSEFVGGDHQLTSRADARLREGVPALIAELPSLPVSKGERLGDILGTRDGNLWWLLQASEKTPFRGTVVRRLHVLALLREVIESGDYDELWLDVEDDALRAAVADASSVRPPVRFVSASRGNGERAAIPEWVPYWLYSLGHVFRWLAASAILGRQSEGRTGVRGRTLFFTILPQWWLGAFSPRAEDRFFPALPERVGGERTAYFAWVNLGPRELLRRRKELRRMAATGGWIWAHAHVSLRAAASLLSPRAFLNVARFLRESERRVAPRFSGFAVRPLVLREMRAAFGTGELARNRMLMAATNCVSTLAPAALVFPDECQPIERALTLGCRGFTTSVGIRHIALDRNYLPFHFADGEIQRSIAGGEALSPPVPDVLLSIGEACTRLPLRQGFPESRMHICGPVRHGTLVAHLHKPSSKAAVRERLEVGGSQPLLFVGTSVSRDESEALLSLLHESREIVGSARLVIRLHPAGKVRQEVLDNLLSGGRAIMCPDGPLYDYLGASDAMITPGSAIAFEAIALGVMPVVFEWSGGFNAHSFADFADSCFVVRDGDELQAALRSVIDGSSDAAARRAAWPALMSAIYTDLRTSPSVQLGRALEAATVQPAGQPA